MKPIYAFNDYLCEVWPLDEYARKHLISLCENNGHSFSLEFTTMGSHSYRFNKDIYFSMKELLTK